MVFVLIQINLPFFKKEVVLERDTEFTFTKQPAAKPESSEMKTNVR